MKKKNSLEIFTRHWLLNTNLCNLFSSQYLAASSGAMMGIVGCCHGFVFLVVYEERLNLLGLLETNEKKMKRNVRDKGRSDR